MDYYNVLIVFKKWVHGLKEFRMWIQKRARKNSWLRNSEYGCIIRYNEEQILVINVNLKWS